MPSRRGVVDAATQRERAAADRRQQHAAHQAAVRSAALHRNRLQQDGLWEPQVNSDTIVLEGQAKAHAQHVQDIAAGTHSCHVMYYGQCIET